MKFKIGDWVYVYQDRWDVDYYYAGFKDNPGQIKYIDKDEDYYAIEFEKPSKYFHNCEGHCKDGHGHWIRSWNEEKLTYAYTLSDKIAFIKELL